MKNVSNSCNLSEEKETKKAEVFDLVGALDDELAILLCHQIANFRALKEITKHYTHSKLEPNIWAYEQDSITEMTEIAYDYAYLLDETLKKVMSMSKELHEAIRETY